MNYNTVLSVLVLVGTAMTISASQQFNSLACMDLPDGIMMPSGYQCDKFYICGDGSLSDEATCPPGMLFNPDKQLCDFPENVDCRDVPLPPWAETTTDPGESTEPAEPNNPNKCPSEDPEYPVFLPVLNECGSYILCFHGKEILMSCPDDLHWNTETMACDDPANVNCESIDETFGCPAEGIDFLPHPDDCRRFIYCRDGFARLQMCFFLKIFDNKQKTCVFGTTC